MKLLTAIKNTSGFLKNALANKFFCIDHGKEIEVVVSTLRIDRVASSGLGISRRNIDLAFLSRLMFLNGNVVTKKSTQVKDGDVIDVIRKEECTKEMVKFDSVKVLEMIEKTLKGKERIILSRKRGVVAEWSEFKDRFKI